MSDYCKLCSIELFGEDFKELANLSTPHDTAKKKFCVVICEGCGSIQVDHNGVCMSKNCLASTDPNGITYHPRIRRKHTKLCLKSHDETGQGCICGLGSDTMPD